MFWIISDTHFGHKNLRKYMDRPENVDELMLANIKNAPYKAGDVLVHLGDVCVASSSACVDYHARLIHSLPYSVHSVLVRGNHDPKTITWYLNAGWDMVVDEFSVNFLGKKILFSHKPVPEHKYSFDFNVHGHFHNAMSDSWEPELKYVITEKHILFDPEGLFKPVRLDTLLTKKEARTKIRLVEDKEHVR